ncbi:PREDICTED: multiple epidermal growth factor-like domains protein 10 [Ceratosolen solmsi marchali]|uniref:Multiple epidermal growth factor-like domains protein 10 n=1 Tax=Ceratosolen solmsi marchali TaxID=326594 RepID=A0AAJ6YHF7_9HYME|nr:PREDICTED: multiple epidermal growth factor-like domains protein 10 [Ceratosolen solmsi marchali]
MGSSRLREFLATLAAAAAALLQLTSALTGDHVCHHVENYTVTSREQYVEPVEIHTLAWCLQIPPRCPQTRTELRERWRTKTEVKFKSVPICCEGYAVQELLENGGGADAKCVPHCKKCRSGVCTAPNECTCDPGYQGQDCAYDVMNVCLKECPQGTWGQGCKNECNCIRDMSCNPVNGKCKCPPGWMGSRCESECPRGQWGAACNSICLCEGAQAQCHHETGECVELDKLLIDPFEASGISVNLVPAALTTAKVPNTDYFDVIEFDREAIIPRVTEHTKK